MMVELSEESSNQIFETLADWEAQLKPYRHEFAIDRQDTDPEGPQP